MVTSQELYERLKLALSMPNLSWCVPDGEYVAARAQAIKAGDEHLANEYTRAYCYAWQDARHRTPAWLKDRCVNF